MLCVDLGFGLVCGSLFVVCSLLVCVVNCCGLCYVVWYSFFDIRCSFSLFDDF